MTYTGIHHVSVLVRDAKKSFHFYRHTLGLTLTLKTVNQDDPSMYHIFFGDSIGQEGSEFTLFEMTNYHAHRHGTQGIDRVVFSIPSLDALNFWKTRLSLLGVDYHEPATTFEKNSIYFADDDGMQLGITVDEQAPRQHITQHPEIPYDYALIAIKSVHLRVRKPQLTTDFLANVLGWYVTQTIHNVTQLTIDNAFKQHVYVIEDTTSPQEYLGVGGMHHVAFGVSDDMTLNAVIDALNHRNLRHQGVIDREFFKAVYTREPNSIIIEIATPIIKKAIAIPIQYSAFEDFPLVLPHFLESQRTDITLKFNRFST